MTTNNHLTDFAQIDSGIMDELSKTADELLKVEHLDSDNRQYLAKALFCLERYDESIEQFKRILSLESDDEKIMTYIAINYFKKGDYKTALEYFDRCLETDPENGSILSYEMLCFEFLKEYKKAVECAERILKSDAKNAQVISRLIDYHYNLKNYNECFYYINKIKFKDHYKKALILFKTKRFEECIEETGKIRTAESYHLAGKAHYELGNIVKAVKYLNKSYEKDFNIDTLFEICEIYFEAEDPARAVHYLKSILIHDENNLKAYSKLAYAYLESGKWYDAIEYAEKALKISKKMPEVYITLAEAYFQLDCNVEKSLEIIDEGLSENPESVELLIEKGGTSYPHDLAAFKESFEKAMNLNPSNMKTYKKYIYLLLLNEETEEAKKWYNQMLLYNPLFEKSFEEVRKSFFL